MSLSSERDRLISEKEAEDARNKKKNSSPPRYNDPVKDSFNPGKGDKMRYAVMEGWYSQAITDRFNQIFNRTPRNKADLDDQKYHEEVDHEALRRAIDAKKKTH